MIDRWGAHPPALARLAWLAAQSPLQPRFPFRGEEAIERAQRRRVAAAIRYAYRYVPYYRDTMDRLGIAPDNLRTASDLARLPLIEHSEVQRDPERFTSSARPLEYYLRHQTGGSSGAPVTVYHDPFALVRAAAYHQRSGALRRAVAGRRFGCRTLKIGFPDALYERPRNASATRLALPPGARRRVVSILDPVERNVRRINDFRPHILSSFGSYLEELFVYLHATGEPFHRPALVTYGADAMSPAARSLITGTFGIPVLSGYGSYEAFGLGFECTAHLGYHINVDLNPLRLVDPEGGELPLGERGEVVISNLVNRGTILLNYRLGDLAAWLPEPCPCGRKLPLLSFIKGRVADWLVTPAGERLHPQTVADVLDEETQVVRYQAVQTTPSRLSIRLVTGPGAARDVIKTHVERRLEERLGREIVTEVQFVDDLPRTAGGKVRTVVGLRAPAVDSIGPT